MRRRIYYLTTLLYYIGTVWRVDYFVMREQNTHTAALRPAPRLSPVTAIRALIHVRGHGDVRHSHQRPSGTNHMIHLLIIVPSSAVALLAPKVKGSGGGDTSSTTGFSVVGSIGRSGDGDCGGEDKIFSRGV